MNVELIDYTGAGRDWAYAACLMVWTKRTRTEMSPGGLEEIRSWPRERLYEELRYMAATVPSSWEFCDHTFLITGATRAFTHQLVRTRFGVSFAQQNMSVQDVSQGRGWDALVGPTIDADPGRKGAYKNALHLIANTYRWLVQDGAKVEDARGLLPTNILTNIVMKVNLRTLCDLVRKRRSPRASQGGEWEDFVRLSRERVLEVHPWAEIFLDRTADRVAADLYALLPEVPDKLLRTKINKLVDQLLTNVGDGEDAP